MSQSSTRARILSVAGELFYREGIRNVGVDAICKKAAVTKPTLYHHFGSKDGLIATYLEERNDAIFAALTQAAETAEGTVVDRIAALFERVARSAPKPEWKGCPFLRGAAEFAVDPDHPARRIASAHKKRLEDWLVDFLADHGIAGPHALARQLIVLHDGAVTHAFLHRDPDYAQVSGEAARTLVRASWKDEAR